MAAVLRFYIVEKTLFAKLFNQTQKGHNRLKIEEGCQ